MSERKQYVVTSTRQGYLVAHAGGVLRLGTEPVKVDAAVWDSVRQSPIVAEDLRERRLQAFAVTG
jgi:hypothetical protein